MDFKENTHVKHKLIGVKSVKLPYYKKNGERVDLMRTKDKLLIYFYNKMDKVDREFAEQVQYHRYHRADELDYLELAMLKVRKDTVDEIFKDIMQICRMTDIFLDKKGN